MKRQSLPRHYLPASVRLPGWCGLCGHDLDEHKDFPADDIRYEIDMKCPRCRTGVCSELTTGAWADKEA